MPAPKVEITWPAFEARMEAAGFIKDGKVFRNPQTGKVVYPVKRRVPRYGRILWKLETLKLMEAA